MCGRYILPESTAYLNPELLRGRATLDSLGRRLGAVLGAARLQKLLEIPDDRLKREIDAVIGSHVVSTKEQRSSR